MGPFSDHVWDFAAAVDSLPGPMNDSFINQWCITLGFDHMLENDVKLNASPGAPYTAKYTTNEELFSVFNGDLPLIRVTFLFRMYHYLRFDLTDLTSCELVKLGLRDPIRLHIKNEPHKITKVRQGRLRLICPVSIVDQLIERSFAMPTNRAEITNFDLLPSKAGISLNDSEQMSRLSKRLFARRADEKCGLFGNDMSGWDWSVQGYMLHLEADFRTILCSAELGSHLHVVWKNIMHAMSNSVFVFGDGMMVSSERAGVMKSGSYLTSSSNSHIRACLAFHLGAIDCIVMGDDCVELSHKSSEELIMGYTNLGLIPDIDSFTPVKEHFEFCSHELYCDGEAVPINIWKMLYGFLSKAPLERSRDFHQLLGELYCIRAMSAIDIGSVLMKSEDPVVQQYGMKIMNAPRRFAGQTLSNE
jgi:hypothetical protein